VHERTHHFTLALIEDVKPRTLLNLPPEHILQPCAPPCI
jgi:hypothetical protein